MRALAGKRQLFGMQVSFPINKLTVNYYRQYSIQRAEEFVVQLG